MAAPQRFRSAFNGFHREDVVNYIEYLNNQHNAQLEQLNNQLKQAQDAVPAESVAQLQAQLDAALQRCAELEAQLAQETSSTQQELETYRRAERAERQANERARQIYDQANAALTDATAMAENAAAQVGQIAERTTQQLLEYQTSISATAENFRQAAANLLAMKPEEF